MNSVARSERGTRLRFVKALRGLGRAAVSRILLGSVIGQGTVLAVSPLLTRLYSPADFAALAIITAVSAVLGSLVTLSWERAIVIPTEDSRATAVVTLGVVSVVVVSALITTVAFLGRRTFSNALGSDVFVDYWWLVPATVAVMGMYSIASSWLVRRQRYGALAVRNATLGVSQAASSVTLGALGLTPLGLITSVAVGRIAALIGMVRLGGKRRAREREDLRETARMYRKFPLVNTWSRLLNSLGLQLPVILIVSLFGSLEAGLYALTLRVLAAPVGVVADAVSQYFEGAFAHRYRSGKVGLKRLMAGLSLRLAAVGFVPALVMIAWGPALFAWVFGAEWETAGVYAQILVVSYLAQLVVSPISRGLIILQRQGTQLAWDASRVIATSAAVVVAAASGGSFLTCAILLASAQVLWYLALLVLSLKAAGSADRGLRP